MPDPDEYHSPDPLIEQLQAVTFACRQVEQIKDPKAKRLLVKAIGLVIAEMTPVIDFTPELHILPGGRTE